MNEVTFQVHVPTPLLQYGFDKEEIQQRLIEWLVLSLFTDGHVSSGKAAGLLNITRVEFLRLLHPRGIAYLNYTPEELNEEFDALAKLEVKSEKLQNTSFRMSQDVIDMVLKQANE